MKLSITSDNAIIIRVQSTKEEIPCRVCGRPTKPYEKGRTLKLQHLSILGKKADVEITPSHGVCPYCKDKTTTTQTLSWYERNGHYTKAYEKHLMLSLINSTISDVCIKEGIGKHAMQNIIDRYINKEARWDDIDNIGIIGIDDISLKKGYKDFVTLITSRFDDTIKILAVIKGREKAEIKAFLSKIPSEKQKTIIAVCSDLYDGYIYAAKEAFLNSVPIVADRFHIAKLYRKCLVDLRIKELKKLRKKLSTKKYQSLKPAIAILKKNQEHIDKDDLNELEKLFEYSPLLKIAYQYCRKLTVIFNTKHSKVIADTKIDEWIEMVESSELTCFDKFIQTLKKYKKEITNYFINRHNSGFVEGFNNKVKVIKRRCYKILNVDHLFQRIFLDLSGYKMFRFASI